MDCLIHEWGKAWFERTGAYVVDVRKIYSAGGVGGYLGKYLSKSFSKRQGLEEIGFKRRWSCSRNFPREKKIQLAGTRDGIWTNVVRIPGWYRSEEMEARSRVDESRAALERIGDDLGEVLRARSKFRTGVRKIGGLIGENF